MRGWARVGLGAWGLLACAEPPADGVAVDSEATSGERGPDLPGSDTETGVGTDSETGSGSETETGTEPEPELEPAAGFVELPGGEYQLGPAGARATLTATPSRQFWAMQPADRDPASAPVFVFFNGGPGVSSGMLLGLNTGRMSFDPSRTGPDQTVVDNPHSWTKLGNLVWIDARQTGFSYGLLDDPGDQAAREAAMSVANFNAYRDAGEFVRTLLAVLAAQPHLRDNPVVLVAESYGGIRAQIMLDMLLHPQAYADGSRKLVDPALAELIAAHHAAVHGRDPGPAQISGQFGRQILIQPALTGQVQQLMAGQRFEQPGSVIELFAAELGEDYVTCAELGGFCNAYQHALDFVSGHGRSPYDLRASVTWLDELFTLVRDRLGDSTSTQALLGVAHVDIVGLAAIERGGGWRAIDLGPYPTDAEVGDWPEVAGALAPWDRYFMPFNAEALARFRGFTARQLDVDPADPHFGELFLANLLWVDTLITDAAFDVVVYTPAIADALASYASWVSAVIVDPDGQEWTIEYAPQRGGEARVIRVPSYEASHAVSLDLPGLLRDDVEAWL